METVIPLHLDPCDPLLFRDGRPFDAASRVQGGMPNPQVLAGALRTAMLAAFPKFSWDTFQRERRGGKPAEEAVVAAGAPPWWTEVRFCGPWPALALPDGRVEPLFAMPEIVYARKDGGWGRAVPHSEWAWWPAANGLLPLKKRDTPNSKADRGLVTLTGLKAFLNGGDVPSEEIIPLGLIHQPDSRIGIEIDYHNITSAEGMMYAVEFKAMNPRLRLDDLPEHLGKYADAKVTFYAEVVLPVTDASFFADVTPVPFGGEGKYIAVHKLTSGVNWPLNKPTERALLYVASPAFLNGSPPLPNITGLTVKAAASGAGIAVSGWDVARNGPRPTRFAVPAGAVYFVEGAADLPHQSVDPVHANQLEGWGFTLTGTWPT